MGENRHTPGPWDVLPAYNYVGYAIAPRGTLPTLAAVERPAGRKDTINVHAFNFPGEMLANACLIAAAPDLYKNAKEVMAALEEHGASIVPHLLDTDDNAGQRLREAIAKADEYLQTEKG